MTGFTGFWNLGRPLPAILFIFLPVSGSSQKSTRIRRRAMPCISSCP
jgi:hypothetical protein